MIVNLVCFSNNKGEITLNLNTVKYTENNHCIKFLSDVHFLEIDKAFTIPIKTNNNTHHTKSLIPTGFVQSKDLRNLSQISILCKFKLMKITYFSRNTFDQYRTGRIIQIFKHRMHRKLSMKWTLPSNNTFWSAPPGTTFECKRNDIWALICALNGSSQSRSSQSTSSQH